MAQVQVGHRRKLGSIPFSANGTETIEIDRSEVLLALNLRLRFTVTAGSSGPATPLFQTLIRLIRRLEVMVGGRDTVWSIDGFALAARVAYENLRPAFGMDDTVVLTGSAAVTSYDVILPLEFHLPERMSRRPDDTALDLRGINQCTLKVTWGSTDASDLFTTTNSAVISAVTCDVEAKYLLGADPKAVFLVRTMDTIEETVTATSSSFEMVMDRKSGLFMRSLFMIQTVDHVGVNSIVNQVKISSGPTVFVESAAPMVRAENRRHFQMESLTTGVLFFPFSTFGQGTTWINTGMLGADLKFVLDVTKQSNTNRIHVTREAVRPLLLT